MNIENVNVVNGISTARQAGLEPATYGLEGRFRGIPEPSIHAGFLGNSSTSAVYSQSDDYAGFGLNHGSKRHQYRHQKKRRTI